MCAIRSYSIGLYSPSQTLFSNSLIQLPSTLKPRPHHGQIHALFMRRVLVKWSLSFPSLFSPFLQQIFISLSLSLHLLLLFSFSLSFSWPEKPKGGDQNIVLYFILHKKSFNLSCIFLLPLIIAASVLIVSPNARQSFTCCFSLPLFIYKNIHGHILHVYFVTLFKFILSVTFRWIKCPPSDKQQALFGEEIHSHLKCWLQHLFLSLLLVRRIIWIHSLEAVGTVWLVVSCNHKRFLGENRTTKWTVEMPGMKLTSFSSNTLVFCDAPVTQLTLGT